MDVGPLKPFLTRGLKLRIACVVVGRPSLSRAVGSLWAGASRLAEDERTCSGGGQGREKGAAAHNETPAIWD